MMEGKRAKRRHIRKKRLKLQVCPPPPCVSPGGVLDADVFLSLLTSPPLRNRVLVTYIKYIYINIDDSFLFSSFLLPFLNIHDTSHSVLTIELLLYTLFWF